MSDIGDNFESTPFTFHDLISSFEHGICIPLVQRNYAMGRRSSTASDAKSKPSDVRSTFLPKIVSSFMGGEIGLYFIYGISESGSFIPLDGQQRLTTLMLAYWFFGYNTSSWKFEYRSRRMANLFVRHLFDASPMWRDCLKKWECEQVVPSKWIRTQKWFHAIWNTDPTVDGMLLVLDAIAEVAWRRKDIEKWIPTNGANAYFYVDKLRDVDHELAYVKMNARGEHLTNWENIKARIDKSPLCKEEKSESGRLWREHINGLWQDYVEGELKVDASLITDQQIGEQINRSNIAFRNIIDFAIVDTLSDELRGDERRWTRYHDHSASVLIDYDDEALITESFFNCVNSVFDVLGGQSGINIKDCWWKNRHINILWKLGFDNIEHADASDSVASFEKRFLFCERYTYADCLKLHLLLKLRERDTLMRRFLSTRILNLIDCDSSAIGAKQYYPAQQSIDRILDVEDLNQIDIKNIRGFGKESVESELRKIKMWNQNLDAFFKIEAETKAIGAFGGKIDVFLCKDGEHWDDELYSRVKAKMLSDDYKDFDKEKYKVLLRYIRRDAPVQMIPWINALGDKDDGGWRDLLSKKYIVDALQDLIAANEGFSRAEADWITMFFNNLDAMPDVHYFQQRDIVGQRYVFAYTSSRFFKAYLLTESDPVRHFKEDIGDASVVTKHAKGESQFPNGVYRKINGTGIYRNLGDYFCDLGSERDCPVYVKKCDGRFVRIESVDCDLAPKPFE